MSCEHMERDLDAYVDRELDVESVKAIRDHINECAACRRQVAEREALTRIVRVAPRLLAQPLPYARALTSCEDRPSDRHR